ncbi:chemotaxis protein MotA [Treponema berlinense]|jgi:chemotaxis protein MotA|uniref:Chemotaxis protein MotA n=1 Tax=Treponema berlinense TaxID=225004 RepID=A0A1T4KGL5_9SPIR|nr:MULTISPECIES: motility protein A [Treponema]MBQ9103215.1 motility protein A [Treponema sp.]MCI5541098.1 motility protein A [Treponema berlinense]MDD5835263.1 motility protein A [Treponema berlinense]MDY3707627.1 motility protein A [Treponema berlinense]SJZ41560.1 chemotaxis protein MotA [Treponema berlinense]
MDIASLIAIVGGIGVIFLGVLTSGGSIGGIIDIPSIFVTVGGSFFSLFLCDSLKNVLGMFKVMGRCFKTFDYGEKNLIQNMVALSEKARREGILALEEGLDDLDDVFLKSGLRMVVDGTDGNVIRSILENEMNQMEARHMVGINLVTQWAGFGPGFGMLGTVIGLIGMLNNLEDKSSLGPNMAVALVTTLYGSMLANWLFGPMAQKLISQNSAELRSREMVLEGVLSIQAGDNPRILAMKLLTYLDPKTRKVIEADVLKD